MANFGPSRSFGGNIGFMQIRCISPKVTSGAFLIWWSMDFSKMNREEKKSVAVGGGTSHILTRLKAHGHNLWPAQA